MRRKFLSVVIFLSMVAIGAFSVSSVHAATPTFSAFYTGNSDYVQLNISNADPNYGVLLTYSSQMRSVGTTNSSGSFSLTISTSQYGITPGSVVSVTVNNQTSNSIQWPYTTSGSGSFYLSPSSPSLSVGQTSLITASLSGTFYLSTNSNPSVASAAFNGNQISITGGAAGTTNMVICMTSNTSSCATEAVTVSGGTTSGLAFSQNNITIPAGQTATVSVSGGTGVYSITSNSNPASVQATLNGSVISLYAGNVNGSSAITVCSTNMSSCGVVTATAGNTSTYSALSFSQTNPVISIGQSTTLTVTGGIAPYYINSNSNSSVVQTNMSSNVLTLSGLVAGSASITVCSATNACGTFTATVTAYGGAVTFGQNSVTIAVGQNATVPVSGSGGYYVSSNSNPGVASAILSGSNIVVSGNAAGTSAITVCAGTSQCGTLPVTVTGGTSASSGQAIAVGQVLSVGQGTNLMLSGGTSPYYVSSNATVCSAKISSGNVLTLVGTGVGSSSVTVCASGGVLCATIPVTVTSATAGGTGASASSYLFTSLLTYGSTGEEVTQLQKKLTSEGVYSGPITGYYGDLTVLAVKKFQSEHGISSVGYVGPSTRAALNK